MPIHYRTGDATAPEGDGVKIIVHCCNDIGAWGAGFVRALSRKWSQPEEAYRLWAAETENQLPLGEVQFIRVEDKTFVANLVGQSGIRGPANRVPVNYSAISAGMRKVSDVARMYGASLHMPRMGCGLAGGSWDMVEAILKDTTGDLSVTVYDLPDAS